MIPPDVARSVELVAQIRPLLHGNPGPVIGAALADLLAQWLAGHPDFMRNALLRHHIRMVRKLIGPNECAVFGEAGHPQNRHGGPHGKT